MNDVIQVSEALVIAVVWQFDVQHGKQDEFERIYGADGMWTAVSRQSRSFLGSSFLRNLAPANRYLIVEYWSEMLIYEKHLADFSDEVAALEAQRNALCESSVPLGLFTGLDVPDRFGPTWSRRDGV